jgi:hypothetical protein
MLVIVFNIFGVKIAESMTLGDLVVGIGTLLLAGFTCWLGFETRASAQATQEAVEASEEPFVIATPTDHLENMNLRYSEEVDLRRDVSPPFEIHRADNMDGTHFVRLKLWNVGSGPAIVQQVSIRRDGEHALLDGLAHAQPIGAGVGADIEIGSSAWPMSSREATLTIDYMRASGLAYRTRSDVVVDDRLVLVKTYQRDIVRR